MKFVEGENIIKKKERQKEDYACNKAIQTTPPRWVDVWLTKKEDKESKETKKLKKKGTNCKVEGNAFRYNNNNK